MLANGTQAQKTIRLCKLSSSATRLPGKGSIHKRNTHNGFVKIYDFVVWIWPSGAQLVRPSTLFTIFVFPPPLPSSLLSLFSPSCTRSENSPQRKFLFRRNTWPGTIFHFFENIIFSGPGRGRNMFVRLFLKKSLTRTSLVTSLVCKSKIYNLCSECEREREREITVFFA